MVRSVVFGTSTLSVLRAGCRLEFLNPKELELSSCTLGCRCLLDRVGAAMISMILGRSAQFGWCLVLGTQSRAEARTSWHERRRMWKTCPLRPPPPPRKSEIPPELQLKTQSPQAQTHNFLNPTRTLGLVECVSLLLGAAGLSPLTLAGAGWP